MKMSEYCKQLKMKCSPDCTYFPNMECREFVFDDEAHVKRRATRNNEPIRYICGYDGHEITSWYDECPKDIDIKNFLKEKQHGKPKTT